MGCIYMYTNKLNGMSYIGQTVNLKRRKSQHKCMNDTYFDKALDEYGEDNFKLTILEDNIFNLDELNDKEVYYINKYDTFNNGYNLTRGGQDSKKSYFNETDRDKIIELISKTNLTFKEIGDKTGYSVYTISDINQGRTFPKQGIEYPIRRERITSIFSKEDIEVVVFLLLESQFSFKKIAEMTNTNFDFVYDINRGKRSKLPNVNYPLRKTREVVKVAKNLALAIVEELKKNDKSAEEIAQNFNLPPYTVGQINRGKLVICKELNESFPIRKKQYKSHKNYCGRKISKDDLLKVIDLLINTTLSTEEISRRFDVTAVTIDRINRGVVFKEELKDLKFPLRQNKDYNLKMIA